MKLTDSFYLRDDVVSISRELLGKVLCTKFDGVLTSVVITETEAYAGVADRASHAYGNRRTRRTEPMFAAGGIAYVYLCYGIHHLFNVVTNDADTPHAILIRAGESVAGVEKMLQRRNKNCLDETLLGGPGSLARALGISTTNTGTRLSGDEIWIQDVGTNVNDESIQAGPRVGVDYAGTDAQLPYRFRWQPQKP